jgi:hypothetical protein
MPNFQPDVSHFERRIFPRLGQGRSNAEWVAHLGRRFCAAPIRDLSTQGIGILCDEQLDRGRRFSVEVPNLTGGYKHLKVLEVVHITRHQDGLWIVGGLFLRSLSTEQLAVLMS